MNMPLLGLLRNVLIGTRILTCLDMILNKHFSDALYFVQIFLFFV